MSKSNNRKSFRHMRFYNKPGTIRSVVHWFAFTLICVLLASCTTAKIYTATDFSLYKADHGLIALLPMDVTIDPTNQSKDVSQAELNDLEIEQGESFQRALYTQFLQRQQRGLYTVEFQDIEKTNVVLSRELGRRATGKVLSVLTKAEICDFWRSTLSYQAL